MAVTSAGNVIKVTADADTIAQKMRIIGVKVVGTGGGMTVNFKKTDTSGVILYTSTVGASAEKFDQVNIQTSATTYINVSAGAGAVYIYLE